MAEIKRVYKQAMPELKLVGKRYYESDKENGTFTNKWSEWFGNNLFKPLIANDKSDPPFEDSDAYIGLCRCKEGEPFEYWIGVFLPPEAEVPDGYQSVTLGAGDMAVCWVLGKEPDIYMHCCLSRLAEEGYTWTPDKDGVKWMLERYVCPRFTNPDDQGNRTLDLCYYVKWN